PEAPISASTSRPRAAPGRLFVRRTVPWAEMAATAERTVTVLLAQGALRDELGLLPQRVRLVSAPSRDVEVLVVDREFVGRLTALFAELPGLRLVQSTNAGIEVF